MKNLQFSQIDWNWPWAILELRIGLKSLLHRLLRVTIEESSSLMARTWLLKLHFGFWTSFAAIDSEGIVSELEIIVTTWSRSDWGWVGVGNRLPNLKISLVGCPIGVRCAFGHQMTLKLERANNPHKSDLIMERVIKHVDLLLFVYAASSNYPSKKWSIRSDFRIKWSGFLFLGEIRLPENRLPLFTT